MIHGRRHHAIRDVCRIKRVMAQWRGRILRCGGPMHERHRTERRFACWTACDREAGLVRDRDSPHAGELHEQIVRMLAVDQRTTAERLAALKDLCVARFADGGRVEAEHAVQRQQTRSHLAHQHTHVPVLSHKFLVPTWAALTIECPEQDAVLHGLPPLCGHLHVVVLLRLRLRGLGGRWLGLRGP